MLLSGGNRVLVISTISTAGTDRTFLDAKVVFAAVLKVNASSIVLSHNHPSGNLQPSGQDKKLTRRLVHWKNLGSSGLGPHHPGPGRIFFLR